MGISSTSNYIYEKYSKERKSGKIERIKNFICMENEPTYFKVSFWIFTISMIFFIIGVCSANTLMTAISILVAFIILILMRIIDPKYKEVEKKETRDYRIIKDLLTENKIYSADIIDALIKESENYLENYKKSGDGMKRFIKSSLLVIQFYIPVFISLLSFQQNQVNLSIQDWWELIMNLIFISIMLRFIIESIDIFEINLTKTRKFEVFIDYLYQIRTDMIIELERHTDSNSACNYVIDQVY